MAAKSYTADDVAKLREAAKTMSDPQTGALLGWPTWKVQYVRAKEGVEAYQDGFWNEARTQQVHRLYILNGVSSEAVGAQLGCSGMAVRRRAATMGWKRDLAAKAVNIARASRARAGQPRQPAAQGGAEPKAVVQHIHKPGGGRLTFGFSPSVPYALPAQYKPLCDRVADQLASRPMPAPSLASILGVNELAVLASLNSLKHQGVVIDGPPPPTGARFRVFQLCGAGG